MSKTNKTGVVAFSGGLDTSFLVPFARETYDLDRVITCTVNTGGFDAEELKQIAARSQEVGADDHVAIDAEQDYYNEILKYLIYGNVSRDGYPLCVGAERLIQAKAAIEVCREHGAGLFLHGSTGAGNDQYRFDLAVHVLGQGTVRCIAPVREHGVTREQSTAFLKERNIEVHEKTTNYSYNVGLWGVSIGGKETHSSSELIPDDVWYSQPTSGFSDDSIEIDFEKGQPTTIRSSAGATSGAVDVIKATAKLGSSYAIGQRYHIGTSLPGKKGRLAYEAPAAEILYAAHRELERITLTQEQIRGKVGVADEFGRLIHEAKFFDPYLHDLAAYLERSQQRVSGTATVHLTTGRVKAVTSVSPYNLLEVEGALYGESSDAYSGSDAEGACKIHAFEQALYRQVGND